MTGPPFKRPKYKSSFRQDEKEGRAFDGGRRVRLFGNSGLVGTCQPHEVGRYLDAPNAEPVMSHDGRLVAIKLHEFCDDRGQPGERRGRSTITTQRVRNDNGVYVGGGWNLKHKSENANHGLPDPPWMSDIAPPGPVRPPLR
jgi:hypothetical protein